VIYTISVNNLISIQTRLHLGLSHRYKHFTSFSRTDWPLRNIHVSNGNGSFPFYIEFLSSITDNILPYFTIREHSGRLIGDRNWLPSANTRVHPRVFVRVRVAHLFSFLWCVCVCVLFLLVFVLLCLMFPILLFPLDCSFSGFSNVNLSYINMFLTFTSSNLREDTIHTFVWMKRIPTKFDRSVILLSDRPSSKWSVYCTVEYYDLYVRLLNCPLLDKLSLWRYGQTMGCILIPHPISIYADVLRR